MNKTMIRENYIAPRIKVRKIESESIMTVSTGVSDNPAAGGAQAKSQTYYAVPQPETQSSGRSLFDNDPWEE